MIKKHEPLVLSEHFEEIVHKPGHFPIHHLI